MESSFLRESNIIMKDLLQMPMPSPENNRRLSQLYSPREEEDLFQEFKANEEEDQQTVEKRSRGAFLVVPKSRMERLQEYISNLFKNFYKSNIFSLAILIATVFVLIANFLRVIIFKSYIDLAYDVLTLICIFIFLLEIILRLKFDKDYFLGFYFFIDLISSVFLIFEVMLLYYPLFFSSDEGTDYGVAIKLLKIVRILRLVRVMKLMKKVMDKPQQIGNKKNGSEAKITRIIKESNMKRLIILILVVLLVIPFFNLSVYFDTTPTDLINKAKFMLPRLVLNKSSPEKIVNDFASMFQDYSIELIYLSIDSYVYDKGKFSYLRPDEWDRITVSATLNGMDHNIVFIVSSRFIQIISNLLMLLNTIMVTLMMIISIISLNYDMSNLILNPLERMIEKVKEVSKNPLQALKSKIKGDHDSDTNETLIIEQAINKISQLLVLGFGQAGCRIISRLLFEKDREIDDSIPGARVRAIFGFCDIRQFTDATEVLLEEVMVFVNSIAEIVHHSVDSFGGAANKNIGDAFLLVWKLHSENVDTDSFAELALANEDTTAPELLSLEKNQNSVTAELALLSFVQIVIHINTLSSAKKYANHPLLSARIPGYCVKMGFGLHEGWAIEGAIGSGYKIDASYLSPNVNMASRLEAATKQFKVQILFSGAIYSLFTTQRLKNLCRHIDTVKVKGSILPLKLYTIDLNVPNLIENFKGTSVNLRRLSIKLDKKINLTQQISKMTKKIVTMDLDESEPVSVLRVKSFEEESRVINTLKKPDFQSILSFPDVSMSDFRMFFSFAIDSYLNGKWSLTKMHLQKCLKMKPGDGPSEVIYDFIKSHAFAAPTNWNKSRELTEK